MPQYIVRLSWRLTSGLVVVLLSACVSTPSPPGAQQRLTAGPDQTAAAPQAGHSAKVQQLHSPGEPPSTTYTVAIVPWKTSDRDDLTYYNGIVALRDGLAGSAFVPLWSAYELYDSRTTRFSQNERTLRQQVWGWRDPNQGPHPDVIWQLGTELGVDAILTYGMHPKSGWDYMWVYLYDIPYKRLYTLQGRTWYYETETAGMLTGLTHAVCAEFRDFRMQRSPREPGTSSH